MDKKILSDKVTQVKDLEFKDLLPTVVDEVTIKVENGRREISLPDHMNGEKFTTWKKRKGGAFYRDVFNYTRDRDHGKYVLITGEKLEYVARLIETAEEEEFAVRRLIHGKIKDKSFMILHNNSEIEEKEVKDGYIEENNNLDGTESEQIMIVNQPTIPQEDEEAGSAKSISLFD